MNQNLSKYLETLRFPISITLLIWAFEIYEWIFNRSLNRWGIYPREWDGLFGIISGPFIHSGFEHLISNSIPLFTLTSIMVIFYRKAAIPSFIVIQVVTGFSVWLFARPSYHIGASGIVYGLVAFVFWSGIFRRNIRSIVLALIIVILYSGYFYGIVPTKEGVSWESHLFGGFAGIFAAYLFKNIGEEETVSVNVWDEEEEKYFLPRDVFEKTKWQRRMEEQIQKNIWKSDSTL
ncbi:MAG TPA: rhomboid family intramembrane serine protease [Saprospiraceae bacterium]|nr:rhomboid family intramembrane serine protease [Saprospiraceae bacterium]